jgi:sensor histidine kinase YesM
VKIYLKLIIHSTYWLVFGSFSLAVSMAQHGNRWPLLSNLNPHYFINFLWAGTAFYLFYFYFIRFFERKQFLRYLLYSLLISIAITILFMPIHKLFYPALNLYDLRTMGTPIAGTFIIVQTGILVRGFENWFSNIPLKTELENKNLKNELELLKSQVNPHFLFNTLNNIDSLIHSTPANASKALITLSEMLRYMIYETKTDTVLLQKEITYVKNYISLQQLRFRNPDYVRVILPDSCCGEEIAPMLFIPFIENAFKFASDTGTNPVIDITVFCEPKSIRFVCRNYFSLDKQNSQKSGGVGLCNVRRRLDLLYPGKHSLRISDVLPVFEVELTIELT